ncbi:MAG TPA: hypothetical protein ENJ44_03950, partial [Oceanospirillales bacterium]|nr:hypothetical protein [Oceanospirillales bacterium]
MKKNLILLLLLSLSNIALAKKHYVESTKFDCIEINKFTADKKNANTRALKRAARIPAEVIEEIQNFITDEVDLDANGLKALDADEESCENPDTALVLNGVV